MGTLTHAELVTEALELAGNTGLTARAQVWLGLVLRHLNEKFSFPQLANLKAVKVVTAGTSSFSVGRDASADVLASVQVNGIDRILMAANDELDSEWEDLIIEYMPRVSGVATGLAASSGRPRVAIVETDNQANFDVTLAPYPDESYRLLIIANSLGLNQATYSAAVVNPYPDDLTVLQGIYALALKHQQDERAREEWEKFEDMAKKDRVRYGNMNHANSKVTLGGPHKRRNPRDRGPGWMGPV
jgi:hypothetical protein